MKEVTVIERNTNFVEAANMDRENQHTFEIQTIKAQTEQMVLMSSIELGKIRLKRMLLVQRFRTRKSAD